MTRKLLFGLLLVLTAKTVAQESYSRYALGFNYGFGSEFNNRNYIFTNHFYKLQLCYKLKESKLFKYAILLQPEINFGKHQLLNLYFVKPDDSDFEERRNRYLLLKDVREYVLNVGFLIRKPLIKHFSAYLLVSLGPMITDTETERMSKGFAFADVLAVGLTIDCNSFQFDVRPSVRHVSNAGLGSNNAGYNSKNIEFGILYKLK
ncbi:acyloxyacyl hydrolase [Flavobacterium foetidum]|uniref:acyloxyacyl hydrolase n=1 Tax=Flavobacterium foetidum TaxID=2026681 RepID=UPI0010755400|nr:acyloxyacyl hydrolase [Flavobacterium foetidum]KAF2516494.1 acyloxyacyl hydrolase [Flavobacterium foetidum]